MKADVKTRPATGDLPMDVPRRAFLGSTAAAAACWFAGCAHRSDKPAPESLQAVTEKFGTLEDRVRDHVMDSSKHAPLLALVDESRSDLVSTSQKMAHWRNGLAALPAEELADRKRLEETLKGYTDEFIATLTRICQRAIEARTHISESQWPLVFRNEASTIEAALVSIQVAAIGVAAGLGGVNEFDQLFGHWDDALEKSVKGESERSQAGKSIAAVRAASDGLRETLEDDADALRAINATYVSTLKEYEAALEAIRGHIVDAQVSMLEHASQLRATISDKTFERVRRKVAKAVIKSDEKREKEAALRDKVTKKAQRDH